MYPLTLELLRSLESLLLFLLCAATSTDFSLLCDRDLESREESRSRELRFEDLSSFKETRKIWKFSRLVGRYCSHLLPRQDGTQI